MISTARSLARWSVATLALVATIGVLTACSLMAPSRMPDMKLYTLDGDPSPPGKSEGTLTVSVAPLRSASGFDSPRMAYVRSEHQLEYYTQSAWVESPADMLAPILVRAVVHNGAFRASVAAGGTAQSDLRLEAEVLLFQQEFDSTPSRARLKLRVTLVANAGRRLLATRVFESVADARSADAAGGVGAANLAALQLVSDIADWSGTVARTEFTRQSSAASSH